MKKNRTLITIAIMCIAIQFAMFFLPTVKTTVERETSYGDYEEVNLYSEYSISSTCSHYALTCKENYDKYEDSMDKSEKREAKEIIGKLEFYDGALSLLSIVGVAMLAASLTNMHQPLRCLICATVGSTAAALLPVMGWGCFSDLSDYYNNHAEITLTGQGVIQILLFAPVIISLFMIDQKVRSLDIDVESEVYKVIENMDVVRLVDLMENKNRAAQAAYAPQKSAYAPQQSAYAPQQSDTAPQQSDNVTPTESQKIKAFCIWCGNKLDGNETVCPVCGEKVDDSLI